MTENAQPTNEEDSRKELAARQLQELEPYLTPTEQPVNVSGAIKLSLDKLPELGIAFASLPSAFRTITTMVNVPTLLQATDKFGNAIDPSILLRFHDGSGQIGAYRNPNGPSLLNARFQTIEGGVIKGVSHIPYDPTMLFLAAAVAQINQKLDAIQATVDELFQYERERDKAELRGSLKTLLGILQEYGDSCDSESEPPRPSCSPSRCP